MLLVLAPRTNVADLSIGAYDSLIRLLAQTREGVREESSQARDAHRVLMYEEGTTSTVSVRQDQGTISMAINGRTNASDSVFDMPTQVMLGQIPILISPQLTKGLVIGFATGVSVGSMLQSTVQSVTCVELERAAIKGSQFFEHVNNRPLDDPRLKVVVDDARTYLRVTPERFDIIASEPSHPWVPGVANLFTREFFEIGRDRLTKDGIFVQWVQIYQLSIDSLRSVLATYQSVFPHVMVFRVGGNSQVKDLILVGSNEWLTMDRISERMTDPRVSAELSRIGLNTPEGVKAWFVCDETKLRPAVAGVPINTDDNMHIETTVPKEAFLPYTHGNAEWIQKLRDER
jgi:spermidine synthase